MTTPLSIRLLDQSGALIAGKALAQPQGSAPSAWTMGVFSCGFRVFHDGTLDWDNGVADNGPAGTIFFGRLEITYDGPIRVLPRKGWSVNGNVLTIGNTPGGDCIPGRTVLRIRPLSAYQKPAVTDRMLFGRTEVVMPPRMRGLDNYRHDAILACLESGNAGGYGDDGFFCTNQGPWHPLGELVSGEGGGYNIAVVSGYNGDSLLDILRADLWLERNHVSCVGKADGEPLPTSAVSCANYTQGGGVSKAGELPAFCHHDPANSNPDSRVPNQVNAGTCSYQFFMEATDIYGHGAAKANGEHRGRDAMYPRAAARMYGDEPSKQTLKMMAQDIRYAWKNVPGYQPGQGSGILGRRECGWVALLAEWDALSDAIMDVSMPTGVAFRWLPPYSGAIPPPDVEQVRVEYGGAIVHYPPCVTGEGVVQHQEAALNVPALLRRNYIGTVETYMMQLFETGYVAQHKLTKYSVVSTPAQGILPTFGPAIDWLDYMRFVGWGLACCANPRRWLKLEYLNQLGLPSVPMPHGGCTSVQQWEALALADLPGRDQLVPALAAIGKAGL